MPCTLMAMPLATVVSMEQVSGQSCGQAPKTWLVGEEGVGVKEVFMVVGVICAGPFWRKPFYFTKSHSPLIESGAIVPYPAGTSNYHFEMALVVAIGAHGFRVKESDAASRDLR